MCYSPLFSHLGHKYWEYCLDRYGSTISLILCSRVYPRWIFFELKCFRYFEDSWRIGARVSSSISGTKCEGNEFCRFSLVTHWDDNTGSVLFTWDYLWLPEFTDFQSIFISKRVEKATISEHKIHMIGKCIGD